MFRLRGCKQSILVHECFSHFCLHSSPFYSQFDKFMHLKLNPFWKISTTKHNCQITLNKRVLQKQTKNNIDFSNSSKSISLISVYFNTLNWKLNFKFRYKRLKLNKLTTNDKRNTNYRANGLASGSLSIITGLTSFLPTL